MVLPDVGKATVFSRWGGTVNDKNFRAVVSPVTVSGIHTFPATVSSATSTLG